MLDWRFYNECWRAQCSIRQPSGDLFLSVPKMGSEHNAQRDVEKRRTLFYFFSFCRHRHENAIEKTQPRRCLGFEET